MSHHRYRVSIAAALAESGAPDTIFESLGFELLDDGSVYLSLPLGAEILSADMWETVTITKIGEQVS
ncbi:hypothetical protein [Novosphingobium sp. JCM 18896]|uniref:hypothetical protein n=1 Tax=Novosphingobium sp. JCM 18896 TaxID=2989731 RepID=UPI0022231D5C|nr:hypothetical protein [Novosphingobium sp. JCM 18896]MCW1431732.1 hypothetical protein [Novosphingobium sp. JCM 18896]